MVSASALRNCLPKRAVKWGVVGMTKSMAVELAEKGVRINALSPGLIATQIWNDIMEASPNREESESYWNSNIPQRRAGTPEEVAKAALFLAGDDSSYFNGANILCDGGMSSALVSKPSYESASLEGGSR